MSAPNFNCHHNSRHLNVFCIWDDFDSYKEDLKTEDPDYYKELSDYLEDPASYAFYEWCDDEKDYYLNFLEESLKEKFGQSISVKKDMFMMETLFVLLAGVFVLLVSTLTLKWVYILRPVIIVVSNWTGTLTLSAIMIVCQI